MGSMDWQAILREYRLENGRFDEFVDPQGNIRPHWKPWFDGLSAWSGDEFERRWAQTSKLIEDNRITYNVYQPKGTTPSPWQLDSIPLILAEDEWKWLEQAIVQRATLINTVLKDIHGEQKLIKGGQIPSSVIYGHPGFLHPCHGAPVEQPLVIYAADLARSPDGRWWVISDRTQAPSGMGYALENRIVMSRMVPELISQTGTARLGDFFHTVRRSLTQRSPRRREKPVVALLTPGPFNETYFEHAYLARSLGYLLLQGQDLTVRDGEVFLKSFDGLVPIDVLLRRVDDHFCDPLELKYDSFLGIPGLMQAVHQNGVAVANALGSGWAQNPALMAFLPGLCQTLLGEKLKMPSVATWWCGDPSALKNVEERMSQLVLKPLSTQLNENPIFGWELGEVERSQVLKQVRKTPWRYVGQEHVTLSTAPAWRNGRLEASSIALRVYAVAVGDSFAVMPGGLTRVAYEKEHGALSMQRGGGSKDTWVQAVVSQGIPPSVTREVQLLRGEGALSSRMADNLFWLGRYTQRMEGLVRLVRTVLERSIDGYAGTVPLLMTIEQSMPQPNGVINLSTLRFEDLRGAIDGLMEKSGIIGGGVDLVEQIHRLALAAREQFSNDVWRVLSHLKTPQPGEDLISFTHRSILEINSFWGLITNHMVRSHAWHFLEMGHLSESILWQSRLLLNLLQSYTRESSDTLEAVLETTEHSNVYRTRYFESPRLIATLDLLLADETNPHSIVFQLGALEQFFQHLPCEVEQLRPLQEEKCILAAHTALKLVVCDDFNGVAQTLNLVIQNIQMFSDALTRRYLDHAMPLSSVNTEVKVGEV